MALTIQSYPRRVLIGTMMFSALTLGLCVFVAARLDAEQGRTATTLEENIASRGASINLEASLNALAVQHEQRVADVQPLVEQVRVNLAESWRCGDKIEERRLIEQVGLSFQGYQDRRQQGVGNDELAANLRQTVIPAAMALRVFNGMLVVQSAEVLKSFLTQMTWGLLAVGGLGSLAGLILGYGLARGLRRSISQLLIRIEGATDTLGRGLPAVEWQPTGEPLHDGGAALIARVEQIVLALQEREREVRRAERLAALGTLAAGVAHEIRNPLTAAILLLETARQDPSAGGLTDEDQALIETELHRVEKSLKVLIEYARPPKLKREEISIGAVVSDALNLARGRATLQGVTMKFVDMPGGCTLEADREQLRQVFLNLILNGLDAMPAGGLLTIALSGESGRFVAIAVRDTGTGIRGDILPRMFEPYASGKETGLGLGLVVAQRIVEDHGGTLQGENPPEGGALFTVRLPMRAGSSAGIAPVILSRSTPRPETRAVVASS